MLAAAAPAPIAALILVPTVTETAAPRSVVPDPAIVLEHGARANLLESLDVPDWEFLMARYACTLHIHDRARPGKDRKEVAT
jgi:hypothetical protein